MHSFIIKNDLSEAEENYIKIRFFNCFNHFNIPSAKTEECYDRLYFEYSAWSRHYHNLSHIYSLLKLSELYSSELKNPILVDLAIWFHDAVYDSSKKDNELQSSILFEELMQQFLSIADLEQVKSLIMSTSGHLLLMPEDNDHKFFLDFDLAILSSDNANYRAYADAIREEYKSLFSFFVYNGGRKKVLKSFLDRKSLYFSATFKEKYEASARRNLEWEILGLKEN
jgi:predicted metal-dependent HD superfamily phosphohydrolase